MRISIVGTGYVGLVTGACFADRGHQVVCVDIDSVKVNWINSRKAPIHEEGLQDLLDRTVGKTLSASNNLANAVAESDITVIAVGTPAAEGKIDLSYIEKAAEEIGTAIARKNSFHTVVVKSTVIPGTTNGIVRRAVERTSGKQAGSGFGLGMNPEFLTEGTAVSDFTDPDRIVVGGIDEKSIDIIASVYESFAGTPLIRTNTETAEMIKYASNSVLATLISFSNELGRLCTKIGNVDIADVMRGVHAASYFNVKCADGRQQRASITSFLEAGCGYGGSCLPKDVTALVGQAGSLGLEMPLLSSVIQINKTQPEQLLTLIRTHYPSLEGLSVAILGLAFKPDTDDVRESPAFPIIRALRAAGAEVVAYDPVASPETYPDMADVPLAASLTDAIKGAEVVVHVTRWGEFRELPEVLHQLGRKPLVVDGRRNLRPGDYERYEGIGRRMTT